MLEWLLKPLEWALELAGWVIELVFGVVSGALSLVLGGGVLLALIIFAVWLLNRRGMV